MILKPIKEEFRKNGYDFRILKLMGNIALFELKKDSSVYGYEVHKLRIKSITGVFVELPSFKGYTHCNTLPSNEDFGNYGWSYQNYENAIIKFKELEDDNRSKQEI